MLRAISVKAHGSITQSAGPMRLASHAKNAEPTIFET